MLPPSAEFQRIRFRMATLRNLVVVLGDQLNGDSAAFDGFYSDRDAVWLAEVAEESTHVWSHKARTALFLSAMRHFAEAQSRLGRRVLYRRLDDADNRGSLAAELTETIRQLRPERVILVEPGDYRVRQSLLAAVASAGLPLVLRPDRHFLYSVDQFAKWAAGRKQYRLEFFYRELRRRLGVLMSADGQPEGGQWNFDADNREAFGPAGPGAVPAPRRFLPDAITTGVLAAVENRFPNHPGSLSSFDWPVTPTEAETALADFVEHRLPSFGRFQDAMCTGQPWLYHSRLSAALNLKLLDPRTVVAAAERAYRAGRAPLSAVEGFVRQIVGWREYVRGLYWLRMPGYATENFLAAEADLPEFYWTGQTDMACLRAVIGQTLATGYAHHIQRLMVTGLYALLLGVQPRQIHEWYLAIYVDAVEWVELPNVIGMSQFADGGVMASKPYAATGQYIQRMSNYCDGCRYDPRQRVGPRACPFTTLYWDFLLRHRDRLADNQRFGLQLRNADRLGEAERSAIARQAADHRAAVCRRWPGPSSAEV